MSRLEAQHTPGCGEGASLAITTAEKGSHVVQGVDTSGTDKSLFSIRSRYSRYVHIQQYKLPWMNTVPSLPVVRH